MITPDSLIAVYMMASRRNGTLYVGVTSDLHGRVGQHKRGEPQGFTSRYGCKTLVWYEPHPTIVGAIDREKRIKAFGRARKLRMIEAENPEWRDLAEDWFEETSWDFDGSYEAGLKDFIPPIRHP